MFSRLLLLVLCSAVFAIPVSAQNGAGGQTRLLRTPTEARADHEVYCAPKEPPPPVWGKRPSS